VAAAVAYCWPSLGRAAADAWGAGAAAELDELPAGVPLEEMPALSC
jgi:hypothetical protein